MIDFLKGTVAEALPNQMVIDVSGVGYLVSIPLSTFDALNPLEGDVVTLRTHLHIRETAHTLYGFSGIEERDVFRLLIDRVSGIGPSIAMSVLSGMSVGDFKSSVVAGDVAALTKVKGLGKKTAERIVLELKDKVGVTDTWQVQTSGGATSASQDAELALIALGYKQTEARKAVQVTAKIHPDSTADELIRHSLRGLNQ